jgi:peptidoglycan/xylan/chitin deacetylase (PgdA/CDA1 family)
MKYMQKLLLAISFLSLMAGAGVFTVQHERALSKAPLPLISPPPAAVDLPEEASAPAPVSTPSSTPQIPQQVPTAVSKTPILMYHYVRDGVNQSTDRLGYRLSVRPSELDAQLQALTDHGYTALTMSDYVAGKALPTSVVMTFDDGYADFYTEAYPIFKKYGWTATLYIISGKIGGLYMSWDQLKELQQAGFEIGAHTVDHADLSKENLAQQHTEIFESKATLERQLGVPVTAFCYPSGKFNDITLGLVKQAGFTSATTTKEGITHKGDDLFTLKRVRMLPDLSTEQFLQLLR